jgi:hypothetical protein
MTPKEQVEVKAGRVVSTQIELWKCNYLSVCPLLLFLRIKQASSVDLRLTFQGGVM